MFQNTGEVTELAANGSGRPGSLLRAGQLCFGFAVLLIAGYWIGVGGAGMARVSLVRPHLVYPAADLALWALMTVLIAAGIAACVTPSAPPITAKRQVDFVQLAAALGFLCLIAVVLPFVSGLEFTGPEDQCISGGCWPRPYQELLIASPALLAVAAVTLCGIAGSRTRWWVRSLTPAVTFTGASAVQLATWQAAILPFLGGPSPLPL